MLSSADADLARRDSAIPGLPLVLDPDALLAALRSSLPEADLRAAEITGVKYRPGLKCLVGYRLDVAGSTVELYAKARRSDAHGRGPGLRQKLIPPGPLGPGQIVLEDRAILISFFPNDRKLKGLSGLARTGCRKDLLRELMPDRPDLWEGAVRSIRYKPERRYVAQLVTGDGVQAALKFGTESRYAVIRANAQIFASRGPLSIAHLIAHSNQHCILVFEWLSGPLLRTVYTDPGLDLGLVPNVGGALAELQAQTPKGLACRTRQAEVDGVHLVAAGLGLLCPYLAKLADDLARRLALHLTRAPRLNASIHGDFTPRQVVLTDSGIGIVDFDEAVRGDPAADLGWFVSRMERDALHGDLPPSRVEPLKDALLNGYRVAADHPIPARIELYTVVGLLQLATNPFRYHQPNWPERTEAILERAALILGRFERSPRTTHPRYAPV